MVVGHWQHRGALALAPILGGAQLCQPGRGERHPAVLGPFALLDPQQPALAVAVGHPHREHLAQAPPAAIAQGQQGAVTGIRAGRQDRGDLGAGQQPRDALGALG